MTTCKLLELQELLQEAFATCDMLLVLKALKIVDQEVNDLVVFTDTDSIKVIDKEDIIDGTV